MAGPRRAGPTMRALTGLAIGAIVVAGAVQPALAALTEGPRLSAIYDTILAAKFDQADADLARACPPAPDTACKTLKAISLWWQILQDPDNRRLDARFNDVAAAGIQSGLVWTAKEPSRGEAWFYLAGSYGPLVNLRVLRGERVAAARDGNRIRESLERALALDASLQDAWFGIGLYHYYADVAPAAAKVLRWLLFLPGGDRVQGLREMLQARDRGQFLKGEADYQLHILYLWYEHRTDEALRILRELDSRYPTNAVFLRSIAEIENVYRHDHPASAAAWQQLIDRARQGRVNALGNPEARATLGLAAELDAVFETDKAIELLTRLIAARPSAPYGVESAAQLQLGIAYDRLGQIDRAARAFAAAAAAAPPELREASVARVQAATRARPDAQSAEAYRLSLDGWRAFERREAETARATLTRALALSPNDALTRVRLARVHAARGDRAAARTTLEPVVSATTSPAPVISSAAFLLHAQLLEQSGDRTRALAMYRLVTQTVGGDPGARDEALRAIKKLSSAG